MAQIKTQGISKVNLVSSVTSMELPIPNVLSLIIIIIIIIIIRIISYIFHWFPPPFLQVVLSSFYNIHAYIMSMQNLYNL